MARSFDRSFAAASDTLVNDIEMMGGGAEGVASAAGGRHSAVLESNAHAVGSLDAVQAGERGSAAPILFTENQSVDVSAPAATATLPESVEKVAPLLTENRAENEGPSPVVDYVPGTAADGAETLVLDTTISLGTPLGCQCAFCAPRGEQQDGLGGSGVKLSGDPTGASGPGLYSLLNLQQNPDGSYYFTGDRNVDAILIGSKWATLNLTYSFPTSGSEYPAGYDGDVAKALVELGTFQKQAALTAFNLLSSYTNLTFTEAAPGTQANIRIAQTGDSTKGSATGQFPTDFYQGGDIWFGRTNQPYYDYAVKGAWGYATMLHEIGHTMGLKHGHQDYTLSNLSGFFGPNPRPGSDNLVGYNDGQAWSLMTYTLTPGNDAFGGEKVNQPQSYMQYDIAALQYLYGANYNTNGTATTYTWSETTGEMFINGVGQGAPSGNKVLSTVWDGGGVDTYDFSNYDAGVVVDLRPGQFTTFSRDQLANHSARPGGFDLAPGNIANALLFNNNSPAATPATSSS